MLKWVKRFVILVVFAFAGMAVYGMGREQILDTPSNSPQPQVQEVAQFSAEEIPALDMLIVQVDPESVMRRVLRCERSRCAIVDVPTSLSGDALSDGKSWYHYVEREDKRGNTILVLQRVFNEDGRGETIVEETPLVRPRDLYISPDGTKVAYWLDNISDNEGLTELWVYDAGEEETRLVAEKLVIKDVLTRVRWNRSGTALWFLSAREDDEIEKRKKKKENDEMTASIDFATVDVQSASVRARFTEEDWEVLKEEADRGVMDINFSGSAVAFYERDILGSSYLVVTHDRSKPERYRVEGPVTYIQWLEDDSIVYSAHSGTGFAFWKIKGSQQTPIVRLDGALRSAHGDTEGKYMAFVSQSRAGMNRMYVLDLKNRLVKEQGVVPQWGEYLYVVYIDQPSQSRESAIAGLTSELEDQELSAFIQKRLPDIVGATTVAPVRMVVTDSPNTVFVDYRFPAGTLERVLVTVKDAVHPEWEIRAKYESVAGEWQKIQGGSFKDPNPVRMYEWEEGVGQWILKQEIEK